MGSGSGRLAATPNIPYCPRSGRFLSPNDFTVLFGGSSLAFFRLVPFFSGSFGMTDGVLMTGLGSFGARDARLRGATTTPCPAAGTAKEAKTTAIGARRVTETSRIFALWCRCTIHQSVALAKAGG
jgi:hypothetical protein